MKKQWTLGTLGITVVAVILIIIGARGAWADVLAVPAAEPAHARQTGSPTLWQVRAAVSGGSGVFSDSGQSLGSASSMGVALGDVDGDGDLDAFVANWGHASKVWLNDGTGTFSDSGQSLGSAGSYGYAVALGDVDGDGDPDAFVAHGANQGNKVWLNDGTGIFSDSGQSLGSAQSISVALGDVDGDTDLDAFVVDYGGDGDTSKVWLNDGTGIFSDSGQSLGSSSGHAVALGAVDSDGDLDAFLVEYGRDDKVCLNDGTGTFSCQSLVGISSASMDAALGDVDGDGDLDAFVVDYGSVVQGNKMWLNDGEGHFSDSGQSLGSSYSRAVALGDVDGDGDLDAFVANSHDSYGQGNKVWLNDGTGIFSDSGQSLGDSYSRDVALGDVDGDGDLDAFVGNGNSQPNKVWLNQPITTTLIVTSTADSGPGTLRQALLDAGNGDTITFDPSVFPPGSPATIALTSGQLSDLDDGNVTIDASDAGVILDGNAFSSGEDGFGVTSSGNVIKGMQIVNFPGDGIEICCGTVQDNVIGGSTPADRNVISGNGQNGIRINGADVMSNTVSGNYIGTDASGTAALPNGVHGISISDGASYNLIGGSNATPGGPCSGECNLIGGNTDGGIEMSDSTMSNTVSGNYIGVDASGMIALGNNSDGVLIGGQYNRVGGTTSGERNLISGNGDTGVSLRGSDHLVVGNYIGTNISGTAAISNGYEGIRIQDAHSCTIQDNLLSGNVSNGIEINPGHDNLVIGNLIGTDAIGTASMPNKDGGIIIVDGSYNNIIGGDTAADRNIISGNEGDGVHIYDHEPSNGDTISNTISGNYIGVDASGASAIPNDGNGVSISNGASYNLIGGDTPGERNLIVSNRGSGVQIGDTGTMSNTVQGNYIGLDLDGARQAFPADVAISPDYPNDCTLYVATLSTGVHKSTDCGDTWAEVNTGLTELRLLQVEIPPDATNADTVYALAENGYLFVTTDGGANWSLVSTTLEGIDRCNLVLSADFGNDQTMYAAAEWWSWWELGDGPGVFKSTDGGVTWERMVNGMSDDHVWKAIASPDLAEKETLFALTHSGIEKSTDGGENWSAIASPDSDLSDLALSPAYASDQTAFVTSNNGRVYWSTDGGASWSGVDALRGDPRFLALSPDYLNDQAVCHGGGWNDWIYCSADGGATWTQTDTRLPGWLDDAGTGIVFSSDYPTDPTMFIISVAGMSRSTDGGATWELVRGLRDLGNTTGVSIGSGASYNTIGPDNVISNNYRGVTIGDDDTAYNVVVGNLIGADPTGTFAQANNEPGVTFWGGHHNRIGGSTAEERNVISGNGDQGVGMWGTNTFSNTVSGNYIGTDSSGTVALGNRYDGVHINGPSHNQVIDNLISGNEGSGVSLCCTSDTSHNTVSGNYIGTDASGTVAIPNDDNGVSISDGANYNLIGGDTAGERNVISGNGWNGVSIRNSGTMSNTVSGNYIGVDASGANALPNQAEGINIHNWASYNLIGGPAAGEHNVISANGAGCGWCDGIFIGDDAHHNTVQGNYIGTDATGTSALGNRSQGIDLYNRASDNVIRDNLIAASGENGIAIWNDSTRNVAEGNLIGTDASGTQPLGNGLRSSAKEDVLTESATRLESQQSQPALSAPRENYPPDLEPGFHSPERWSEMQLESIPTLEAVSDRAPTFNLLAQTSASSVEPSENGQSHGEVESSAEAGIEVALANSNNAGDGVYIGSGASLNTVGINNTIAFNGGHGVQVEGGDTLSNTITRNSIFRNDGAGIALTDGGNDGLAAPRLTDVDVVNGMVNGIACPGCTLEIYSADDEQGRVFEGETMADGAGGFAFNKGTALAGPNVTATATDAAGNTSPFSPLFEILWVDLGVGDARWALERLGLVYTEVDGAGFASVDLNDYDVLFVGSARWAPSDDYLQPLVDREVDIAAYVAGGGGLVVLGHTDEWGGGTPLDWSWVPVTVSVESDTGRKRLIAPEHLVAQGLNDNNFHDWWVNGAKYFSAWDWPEATSVAQGGFDSDSQLLVGPYGAGRIVLCGSFPDASDSGDPLLRNLLTWAAGTLADVPPQLTEAYPVDSALAATQTGLRLTFSEIISPTTVTNASLAVVGSNSGAVTGQFITLDNLNVVRFQPDAPFQVGETVTVILRATVEDMTGNGLDGDGDRVAEGSPTDDVTWTFTVRAGETLVVTNPADEGNGTLRQALQDALPGDTITFDPAIFPPDDPVTIYPGETVGYGLPTLDMGYVTLDASDAGVVIDPEYLDVGLRIQSDGNIVRGLTIIHGDWTGLEIRDGASFNLIGGDRTGGSGPSGQGNTIGLCQDRNVHVQDTGTISNTFLGNYIGTDPTGTQAWPSLVEGWGRGLVIDEGAAYTTIGSTVPGERNLLSGNEADGLELNGCDYSLVIGNYLGTDASGLGALPNGDCGVDMQDGARYNQLEGNVFSGNWCGVQTDDPGTGYNEFIGNYFGVDASGTNAVPNSYGLYVLDHVEGTLVEGNVFANTYGGIFAYGHNNVYRNNYIGTDPTETADWGHQYAGITVYGYQNEWGGEDSYDNVIEDNVIANNGQGVVVEEWGGARVDGNTISTNSIYNNDEGISLHGNANNNLLPPVVTSFNTTTGDAAGTTCAGCTIEVFSDADNEGRWYEGTATADGAGNWSFSKGSAFTGANVHATATDANGNTSEFSGPSPIVSSVSPTSTVPDTSDLGVTINGDHFRDNEPLTVDFGDGVSTTSVSFYDSTQIKVYLDVDSGAALGLRDVTVTNYDGQSGALSGGFEIVSVPPSPPTVTAVNPDEVAPDVSGNLTIHGAGFMDRPGVVISGDGVTVNWVSFDDATRLTVSVSVDPTATLGARDVTVTNPDGQSDTLVGALTIVTPYFTDEAPGLGLDVSSGEHGAAWGDLDGDGWLDLAIGDGSLFTNMSGSFSDATAAAGLDPVGYMGGVAWGDYDSDGDLDLLSSWRKVYRQDSLPFAKVWDDNGDQPLLAWVDYDLDSDLDVYASGRLYRNEGGDTFVDVTDSAGLGIPSEPERLASVWADYDSDGDPDLYITCNGCENQLYRNNGDGTFVDVTSPAGVGHGGPGHGAAWGDYDNDGHLDIFVANNNWQFNVLYHNNADGTFQDVSAAAGLHDRLGSATGMSWLDYNLDGWLDIFVVNRDNQNRLYRNNGDGTFTDYRLAAGVADPRDSEGSTVGDYDNDGDPDIYVVSGIRGTGTPNFLFRNNTDPGAEGPHWFKVKLEGTLSNRSAIGAVVRVYGAGLTQTRRFAGSTGYMSQDALEALFGFGDHAGPVTVEVTWPSGLVDTLTGVAVDQVITVIESGEGAATISEVKVTNVRDTSFTASWITDIPSDGHVNYGTDPATLDQIAYDDRGGSTRDDTHYVTIEGLSPNTTYYFDVVSGGTADDNEGAHYTVTTGPTLGLPSSDTIFGQVFKEDETTPAEGDIVYITPFDYDGSDSPGEAAPLSALVDDTGYWYANLGNARTSDLSAYFVYSASGDKLKLEAQGAADGTGYEPAVDTGNDTPAPTIYLSHTVFREIRLQIGWNHISLPLDPLTPYTAEGVCDEIISQGGDVAEIDRWYASGWDGHVCGLPFNDFPLELGFDYFIKSSAVMTWTIEGYPVTTPVPLDLQIGWNSIGIPHTDEYTAQSLCDEVNAHCGDGTAVEVDRWYASGWDGHICGLPFNDFDIEIGKGYFVKASDACTVTPDGDGLVEVTILHTNDLHGRLETDYQGRGGSAYMAGVINDVRDEVGEDNVFLVDAGDVFFGAPPISQLLLGESTNDIYNMLGYDVAALGNHEFDKGQDVLQARVAQSDFPWIGANVVLEGTTWEHPTWIEPYVILTKDGVDLGIIGLATDETPVITVMDATDGLEFKDLTEAVLHYYDEVKAQSDAQIVLAHMGTDDSGPYKGLQAVAQELIDAGKPVDLMVAGHQHQALFEPLMVGDTAIIEAGYYGRWLGRADVTIDPSTKSLTIDNYELITINNTLTPDTDVEARVQYWADQVAPLIEQVVGYTNVSLVRDYNGESNTGNLVTDGMKWKADLLDDGEVNGTVDIAFTNPGGLRADIEIPVGAELPYPVTWGDTFNVMPFGNTLFLMDLTGTQIQELLDQAATLYKGILQTSGGAWYWYNDCNCTSPTVWGAYDVTVNGEPLDPEETYRVVTNNFLAGGRDGWVTFAEGANRWDTYYDMQEAVNDYIALNSPISPSVEGRIVKLDRLITILHTNDTHSNWSASTYRGDPNGMVYLASHIAAERARNPHTLLLDAGDTFQGNAFAQYFRNDTPNPIAGGMNLLGYDAMVLGNHEFNFGSTTFATMLGQLDFPILGNANLDDDGTYGFINDHVEDYIAVNVDGVDVVIFGLTNPRVPRYELPTNIAGLAFYPATETAASLVPTILTTEDPDLLIGLTHIGYQPYGGELDSDQLVAQEVAGIDVIVGGHSHARLDPAVMVTSGVNPEGTLIGHAYKYAQYLGKINVGLVSDGAGGYDVVMREGYLLPAGDVDADADLAAYLDPFEAELDAYLSQEIGQTTVPIDALEGYTQETNGANLQVDASMWELGQHGVAADFHLSGAMSNRKVADGATPMSPVTLTVDEMYTLMPYENSLVVMQMNGPQIKTILERAYRNYWYYKYDAPNYGGYSHYTTCMLDINEGGVIAYNDTYPAEPDGNNVASLVFDGTAVDFADAATYYNVSTVNYVAAGSCNFNDDGVTLWPLDQVTADTQYYVRDAVINYISDRGTVSPMIEGRLQFIE